MQTAIDDYINVSAPMKRWGQPQEVARSLLFVASDDAAYITGGDMLVDGAWGKL